MKQPHTIIAEGNAAGHPIGTVCYEFNGHDYGCARDDTRATGEPWVSMTLDPEGKGPYFTAAVRYLEPQPMGHYQVIGKY